MSPKTSSKAKTSNRKADTKPQAPRRRTRMIALEPRMLFDGALGLDLSAQATAVAMGDASAKADATVAPAAPEAPRSEPAAAAVPADKDVLDARAGSTERKEIVFVDARIANYEGMLAGVDPKAQIVFLDADRDGVAQIANALSQYSDVTAVHIIAQGSAGSLQLGSGTLNAASMQGLDAQRIASIGEHLSADATILIHGSDFGKGDAGSAVANRLALLTGADVVDVDEQGSVEKVGSAARQEIVFVDPTVRDFQTLIDGIDNPNARIVLLDPAKDGIKQMAEVLKQYKSVDAVHIISHGSEGQLDLGSSVLNSITMSSTYAKELVVIGQHLSQDADLLVYGCDFGKGAGGEAAAQTLAQITGADVAASTDATGDAALGGNWDLELKTGAIDSNVAVDRVAQEAWHDVLALHTLDFDTVSAWTAGTSKTYTVDGSPVTISYSGSLNGNPALASNYSGGVTPAQNALQFTLGPTGSNTITIDFSGQPGGSVSNVGFALYDVDNVESAVFTANKVSVGAIAPTQIATSAYNSVTASSSTSATISGNGTNAAAASPNGNNYVYFNTTDITSISFTYTGTANVTLVVLNDITFMGKNSTPPVVDLDASTTATESAGDGFATQAYGNSTGTIPWSGSWVETDATAGGSPTAGQVQVIDTPTTGTDYGLRLNNSGTAGQFTGASRAIDLSGYFTSTITYDYATSAGLSTADSVVVEVSSNGGTNWTLLKTYTGSSASATAYTSDSVSLSGYESANTMIRFRVSGTASYTGAAEYFYVDNVQISGQPTGSSNAYTEGDATGVLIAATADASVIDADSADMSSARVTIGNFAAGDTLTWSTGATAITGSYDSTSGVLTLSGTDSKANYQSVFNTIRYLSISDDPTAGGTLTTRNISVTVLDSGNNESNAAIGKIAITGLNDAPVNAVPGAQSTVSNAALVFSSGNGNAISIADPDASTVQVTLSATNGALTLAGTGGLTFSVGDGTADATMTFSGTQAAINAALNGLNYNPTAGYAGAASLSIATSDLGASGTGGTLTDTDTVALSVLPGTVLDLNSTPTVAPGVSTVTSNRVTNADMALVAGGVPTGWTEGGDTGDGAANSGRYVWTGASGGGTPTATLTQAVTVPTNTSATSNVSTGATLVQTTTVTTNAITAIAVDYVWANSDTGGANDNVLELSYAGTLYARLTTGGGAGTTGSWSYFNGATGTAAAGAPIAAQGAANTGTLSTNTITLGTPVTASGNLVFTFANGPSGGGSDNIAIDNAVVTNSATVTTTVTTVDLTDNGWTTTYTENGAAVSIADADSSIFDAGSPTMVSASITLANPQTGDRLLVNGSAAASGTLASGIAWTRTDSAVSLSGSFTKAQYADAIELVQFENTTDNPSTTARTINVSADDGTGNSNVAVATVNVTAVNDAPALATGSTLNYTENGAASAINAALTVADLDNATLPSAMVSITGGFASAEDVLSFTNVPATMGNIAGAYNAGTGVMTLTSAGGTATLAQWQVALRAVQYANSSDNPSTSARTVSFTVNDGSLNSNTVASTVNVAAVNDASTLATGSTLNYTENGAASAINTALTLADLDNATLPSATVSITGGFTSTEDVLSFTNVPATMGNIAGVYNAGTGVMTLTSAGGTATLAQWQVALRAVQYSNSSDNPSTSARTVSYTVNDGTANSNTVASTVNVVAVNDAPVLATGSTLNYTENGAVTAINTAITVADLDNATLSTGTVSITGGFASAEDVLTFTNVPATMGNITGVYNAGTGVMSLSSAGNTATLAQWQAAFRAVQYSNSSDNPSTASRTVSFTVNDSAANSNTVVSTVNVAAVNDSPVLATGSTLNYTENGAATAINTAVTVADPDNATLSTATVSITGGFASGEDALSFTNVPATMGNIAGVYNAGTGVMTLSSAGNTATLAQWQAALRAVQYSNSSDNPSTSARTVSFTVNDSAANSNTITSTVNVAAVNDAPVLATGSTLNYTENGVATAINTALTVADLDNATLGSGTVSITGGFASAEDALSFTNVPATMGNIAGVYNAGTGVMTLTSAGGTATLAQWQAAFRAVQYSNSSDNPSTSARTVSFTVNDGAANSNTVASTVNVAAVNDAPTVTSGAAASVAEGTSTATVVYTATATDLDGPAITWSLSGADAVAFTINSATGQVRFNSSPNFESQSSYSFDVIASDGTLSSSKAVTVAVTDVAPSITSATSVNVPEGTSTATVVYTAAATDVQGGAVTFSLTGADAAAFTIDNATGAVTFNASPDFETKSSYSFNVVASDGTLTSSQAVTVAVTDVAPSITSATSVNVPEGTSTATVVYTAAATDVQGGTVAFALTGADAGAFTIDNATGAVIFNASPDFETKSSYTFNVVASDGTLTSAQAVTVVVTDIAPSITSATSVTVPEGTATSTVVYTAAATDVQGGAVSFSLSGADAAAFTIDNATGAVTFNASPDFETKSAYTFNVLASDGTLTSAQAVTIAVTDVAPSITSATSVSVPEGTSTAAVVYTAAATDVQGGTVTFSLSGADAVAFTINAATGAVTFNASPDFETKSSYSFNVVASDGTLSSNQAVTVAVSDVNEAPSGANATVGTLQNTAYTFGAGDFGFSDPDAGDAMTAVRIDAIPAAGSLTLAGFGPVTAGQLISRADIDAGNLQFMPGLNGSGAGYASLSFSVRDAALFDVAPNTITINVGWVNQAPTITSSTSATVAEGISTSTVVYAASATDPDPTDTITFSLAGADAAAFTIDNATGAVTFNVSPDFETKSSYSFNVVASDGTTTTGQAVTLTVTDVAPSITSATSVSVPEGTSTATVVYTAAATDVQGGAVTFSLTGADAGAFTIDSATGAVAFNASPDFETQSSYTFNVIASDGTLTSSQAVTVGIIDVAPSITSSTSVTVPEGTSTATVVYTAAATDVQGGAVAFNLTGADAAAFSIDSATGAVTFNSSPDFETQSSYSFNVVASDGTLTSLQAVTLGVTDVAPSITSATSVSVPEGTLTSTVVYTAAATDVRGGAVTFSLTGADAASFSIDGATGAVTFNASPDFETQPSYTFNVVASDGTLTSSQAVTVAVTDVAPTITSATSVSVPEGTATSTVVYTAAATDVQGGAVTFSLTGADAAAFTLDAATGAVTFNASPDFETKSSYSFNVVASDGTLTSSQAVTVAITDVAPSITSATSVSVPEGTSTATVVYTAAATDVQGGAVTFSLSGADAAAFTINNTTGAVTFNASPDFETKSAYSFNVVASDGTLTSSQAVTVAVTDVAPSITSSTSVSVPEGTSTATVVYTAAATDVQGGTVSFSLSGADAAAFTINPVTGAVTFNASPDFETKSSYTFNVVASDGTQTSAQAATVSVTNVNDAPVLAASIPDQPATAGAPFSYSVPAGVFADPDGDPLTYSATLANGSPLPAWLTFNSASGTFTGTPPAGFASIDIRVMASDGTLNVSDGFTLLSTSSAPASTATAPAQPAVTPVVIVAPAPDGAPTQPGSPGSTQLPVTGSAPTTELFGTLQLGQPVDSTVPASRFNPNAPIPGFNVPAALDLNALPATAAGPSDLLGFPVARVSQDEALRTGGSDGLALGNHRLFVYHGIPNMQLSLDGIGSVRIPGDAFAHTDAKAIVQLDARLINGMPLPSWLKFEGIRGQFAGVPPEGVTGSLEIEVVARDTDGREARAMFVLLLEDLRSDELLRAQDIPDLMLGLDVDAKEAEKARLKAEAEKARPKVKADGKPQREAAVSFTDQVRAAKGTRDPLLDKIARSGPDTPGPRR